MNDTLKSIANRRAIRSYQPKQITDAELQAILDAALFAPTAMNQQKWHFTIVQNQAILDRFVEVIVDGIKKSDNEFLKGRIAQPGFHTFHHAPTVVFITADEKAPWTGIDCGAAAENMALAARSLNIGSVLITSAGFMFGTDRAAEIKKTLRIPEGYQFVCAVALGYVAGDLPTAPERNKNVFDFIK